ncbi:MAG: 30S ribosomal protein S6 [Desulfopila sp.]|jgi:small subunit ribosomal protein S6|nr:30S ribosomal protein S6 [Desulfopila sp.]
MRRYETIFILRPSVNEDEINTIVENSSAIIEKDNGKIIDLDRWGMRKLAYPIKKEFQGFYIFLDYSGIPEAVAEMERKFRIDDAVLRYMTVKTADVITEDEIVEAIAQAANKQVSFAESATDESNIDDTDISEENDSFEDDEDESEEV